MLDIILTLYFKELRWEVYFVHMGLVCHSYAYPKCFKIILQKGVFFFTPLHLVLTLHCNFWDFVNVDFWLLNIFWELEWKQLPSQNDDIPDYNPDDIQWPYSRLRFRLYPDDGHGDINGANNDKIRSDKECPNQSTHIHGGIFGLVSWWSRLTSNVSEIPWPFIIDFVYLWKWKLE